MVVSEGEISRSAPKGANLLVFLLDGARAPLLPLRLPIASHNSETQFMILLPAPAPALLLFL